MREFRHQIQWVPVPALPNPPQPTQHCMFSGTMGISEDGNIWKMNLEQLKIGKSCKISSSLAPIWLVTIKVVARSQKSQLSSLRKYRVRSLWTISLFRTLKQTSLVKLMNILKTGNRKQFSIQRRYQSLSHSARWKQEIPFSNQLRCTRRKEGCNNNVNNP